MAASNESQLAYSVLMIRPVRFQSNPLAAETNTFMEDQTAPPARQQEDAAEEFDALVSELEAAGVEVIQFDDTVEPHTPDAVFPNNWVTFHADGRVVLYPMEVPNRRPERRLDIIDTLAMRYGFQVSEIVDLSPHEDNGKFLEGTGSLVLDRVNRVAYACLSARTDIEVLADFGQRMSYEIVAFDSVDRDGVPIYHTNVMMSVGDGVAVICDESIRNPDQRAAVLQRLEETGHEIVRLDYDQLESFAGNMLELASTTGGRIMAMSEQARNSLTQTQQETIAKYATIVSTPIDRIESSAGGSVRCMLAEIHLPRK